MKKAGKVALKDAVTLSESEMRGIAGGSGFDYVELCGSGFVLNLYQCHAPLSPNAGTNFYCKYTEREARQAHGNCLTGGLTEDDVICSLLYSPPAPTGGI